MIQPYVVLTFTQAELTIRRLDDGALEFRGWLKSYSSALSLALDVLEDGGPTATLRLGHQMVDYSYSNTK